MRPGRGYRGSVTYREFRAPAPLAGLVECGWVSRTGDDEPGGVQDVLPDGCMDLIWTGDGVLVAGPDTAPHPARRVPGTVLVGLRFAPGRLPGLLGVPATALRDRREPVGDVLGARPTGLHRHRRAGEDPSADLRAAVALLTDLVTALPGPGPERAAAELAARIGSGAGVAATADALGCTTRTLHRRCLEAFGYGPSVLRRVLRFRRAVALLHAGVAPAEVAARAGYADQPHLSREVRALGGVAPGQLGANRSTVVPSGSSTLA
ncbi:AraC family transcriptional regulator [Pseudonocardia petroleophila]